ncbi:MAG: hypothetical protein PVF73_07910, partial [Bacteroidales bacterium]
MNKQHIDDFHVYSSTRDLLGCNLQEALNNQGVKAKIAQIHYHFMGETCAGVNSVINNLSCFFNDIYGSKSVIILTGTFPYLPIDNLYIIPALAAGYPGRGQSDADKLSTVLNADLRALIFHNPFAGLNRILTLSMHKLSQQTETRLIAWNHDPSFHRYEKELAEHLPDLKRDNVFIVSNGPGRDRNLRDILEKRKIAYKAKRLRVIPSGIYPQRKRALPENIKDLLSSDSHWHGTSWENKTLTDVLGPKDEIKLLALSQLAKHKNITGAVKLAREIAVCAEKENRKVRLIISGMHDIPSCRKQEDNYASTVYKTICAYTEEDIDLARVYSRKNFSLVFLGGIKEEYKPGLLSDYC